MPQTNFKALENPCHHCGQSQPIRRHCRPARSTGHCTNLRTGLSPGAHFKSNPRLPQSNPAGSHGAQIHGNSSQAPEGSADESISAPAPSGPCAAAVQLAVSSQPLNVRRVPPFTTTPRRKTKHTRIAGGGSSVRQHRVRPDIHADAALFALQG